MLINFVGSPSSGKTTTAAGLFTRLKENGFPAEFIVEQARQYIATLRFTGKIPPHESLELLDTDQILIMSKQVHLENVYKQACGSDVTIVSDSSAFNALLYMTPDCRKDAMVEGQLEIAIENVDLIFYCPPTPLAFESFDPNRVHTVVQGREVDASIPSILEEFAPGIDVVSLHGTPYMRLEQAVTEVFARLSGA
jgi:hypothetical protein